MVSTLFLRAQYKWTQTASVMHWDTDVFGFGTFLEIWSYSACLELGGHGRHGQGTTIEQYQSWIRRLPDHVGEYQFFMMLDFRGCDVLMKSSNLQPTYFQYYALLLLVEPRRSLMYLPNAAAGWMMKLLLASGKAQLCLRC